jgi:hypothetical protein
MCDYSLHGVANRPAKVGDKLVSTNFINSFTRGFTEVSGPKVAVCLRPGTELQIDNPIRAYRTGFMSFLNAFGPAKHEGGVAKFLQINLHRPDTHHDALELSSGKIVLLSNLVPGTKARVLQLPANERAEPKTPSAHEVRAPQLADRI